MDLVDWSPVLNMKEGGVGVAVGQIQENGMRADRRTPPGLKEVYGPARFFCAPSAQSLRAVSGPADCFRCAAPLRPTGPTSERFFRFCSLSFADTPEFYVETGCIVGCV